jgi:hypothetical protein
MRSTTVMAFLAALSTLLLAACGGEDKDKEGLTKDCTAAPAPMMGSTALPGSFPTPSAMVFTGIEKDGPSTTASGYLTGSLTHAHTTFANAVKGAPGYDVTKEEQDEADSEVNFAGAGNSGQVKLNQDCRDRTTVTITIRPA